MPEHRRDHATRSGGILGRMASLLGTEAGARPGAPASSQAETKGSGAEPLEPDLHTQEHIAEAGLVDVDDTDRIPEAPIATPRLEEQLQAAVDSARSWRTSLERGLYGPDGLAAALSEAEQALSDSLTESEREREGRIAFEQRLSETIGLQRAAAQALSQQAGERAALEQRLAALEREFGEATAALEEGHEALSLAQRDADDARASLEARESEIEEIRAAASDEVARVLGTSRGEMERLVTSLAKSDERARAAETKLAQATTRLEAKEAGQERLTQEITELKRTTEQLRAALDTQTERADAAEQTTTVRENALEQALAASREEAGRERADRDALRNRLRALVEGPADADPQPVETDSGAEPEQAVEVEHSAEPTRGAETEAEPKAAAEAEQVVAPERGQAAGRAADVVVDQESARRSRRRRGTGERPNDCWVCHRPAGGSSAEALRAKGWSVEASASLCATCRSAGWQLPSGAGTPSRVGSSPG